MFHLREAKISGEKYHLIYSGNDLSQLKEKADLRFQTLKRRWVIVDDNDKLLSYCDDIDKILRDCISMYKMYKKNRNASFIVEDNYMQRLFNERKIPFMNAKDLVTKFAYENKAP